MTEYPQTLYARVVNPDTKDEYLLTGGEPSDVSDSVVGPGDYVEPTVARYVLAGTGEVHHSAPVYVEN